MNQQELAAEITKMNDQAIKIATEQQARSDAHTAKIAALEEAINNSGSVSAEVEDALEAAKSTLQALDDSIPDVTPTPPV